MYNDQDPWGAENYYQPYQPDVPPQAQQPTGTPTITPGYNTGVPPVAAPTQSTGTITPNAVPAGQTTPVPPAAQVTYGGDPQAYVQQLIAKLGLKGSQTDPAALNQIVQGLKGRGVNAALAPAGSGGYVKGITIDGQFIKLVDGNNNWTWLPGGNGAGGPQAIDPSFLSAYTQNFNAPSDAALPQFQGPGAFKPPTADDLLKDPSFLFRKGQITDSVQNSASARGITNSGGTLNDIMSSVNDYSGTAYNALADRNFNVWNSDWNHALDAYGLSTGRANTVYGRALGEFQDARTQYYNNQDRPFQKLYAGASLGAQAAQA